jgi:hypothetical protein
VTDATEAAADAVTGVLVASAVEPQAGSAASAGSGDPRGACLNCATTLTGSYCAACGQPAHIHRSFVSLGHDILHSVFHFDTKLWRTLPELVLRPGRLTRRYIDGERAKFISPMTLYLLSVFLMYAVFSFTGGAVPTIGPSDFPGPSQLQVDNDAAIELTREQIGDLETQLAAPELTVARRTELEARVAGLRTSLDVMESIGRGDWANVERIQESVDAEIAREREGPAAQGVETGADENAAASDGRIARAVREINESPGLMAYKIKTNGYKFSWLLVPLSIPFMWPLFLWRRNVRAYDHAVFVTYSISFMMLLLILTSLLGLVGIHAAFIALILWLVPPLHIYKQLRGTYGLSRFGAFVRMCLLLIAAVIVLAIYWSLLVLIGALD